MSLTGVIQRFKTGTYTITRRTSDTYTNGLRTPGTSSTFTLDASVQPVTGSDLKILPEARRTEDVRVFWTTTQLQTLPNPDVITIASENYEVFQVFTHSLLSRVPFYRIFCARQVVP